MATNMAVRSMYTTEFSHLDGWLAHTQKKLIRTIQVLFLDEILSLKNKPSITEKMPVPALHFAYSIPTIIM